MVERKINSHVDTLLMSDSGRIFVGSWVDDRGDGVVELDIRGSSWARTIGSTDIVRSPRLDVGETLGTVVQHPFGLHAFTTGQGKIEASSGWVTVTHVLTSGRTEAQQLPVRLISDTELKLRALASFANRPVDKAELVRRALIDAMMAAATIEDLSRLAADLLSGPRPGRLAVKEGIVVLAPDGGGFDGADPIRCHVDDVFVSSDGALFVAGWIDDSASPVDALRVTGSRWQAGLRAAGLARVRRRDVETLLGAGREHPFGMWGFERGGEAFAPGHVCSAEFTLQNGLSEVVGETRVRSVEPDAMRSIILSQIAGADYFGHPTFEASRQLDASLGDLVSSYSQAISEDFARNPQVTRYVSQGRKPDASIVVCIFGKPEYLSLQAAAFSQTSGMERYEFVYVCNSPDLADRLLKDAWIAHFVYDLDISVVLLSGNAGFSRANNAAVNSCRSDRILFVNPDVFPRDPEWGAKHADLVEGGAPDRTRLFGVPLYYDDGSLMHGGMQIECDVGFSARRSGLLETRLARVEHLGKGAPPLTGRFLADRPVLAVTGAFMSVDRAWFEALDGFSTEYVFGHYEDADLCLKSLARGCSAWMHDIRFWHLEGKGSTRLPAHEGGSIVNRWLFSRRWNAFLANATGASSRADDVMPFNGQRVAGREDAARPLPAPLAG